MEPFAPSERSMWEMSPAEPITKMLDDEINNKYTSREWRIVRN